MKESTMSFKEFFEKDLTLDKKDIRTLDKIAGKILNNKKLKMVVLTSIAYANMALKVFASADLDPLIQVKNEIVFKLQICICILCIVMCLLEIGKSLIGGRSSDIGSIVMKYGTAIVAVCTIPGVFTWIARLCHVNI